MRSPTQLAWACSGGPCSPCVASGRSGSRRRGGHGFWGGAGVRSRQGGGSFLLAHGSWQQNRGRWLVKEKHALLHLNPGLTVGA